MTLWRCVECAEKFTMRAHCAVRSSGSAARTQRTIPIAPSSTAWRHWSSVRSSNVPAALGPTALTRMFSSPPQRLTQLGEDRVAPGFGIGDVGDARRTRRDCPGSSSSAAASSSTVTSAADDRDARAVIGEAAGGGQSHAAAAADDDGGGVSKPEVHWRPPSGTGPVRRALLGERGGALHGVLGREDRHDELALLLPHLVLAPAPRT